MVAICTVTLRDETVDGRPAHEWRLDLSAERLTIRDLLRDRIRQEADEYNRRRPHSWRGLVQPPAESRGSRLSTGTREFRPVDWTCQFELACEAFSAGRLMILVGDVQADSLDEEFDVRSGTAVTFLRLSSLVGG